MTKRLSLTALMRLEKEADVAYSEHGHGFFCNRRVVNSTDKFMKIVSAYIQQSQNDSLHPLYFIANQVKENQLGSHKIGSFRNLLAYRLYKALKLGPKISEEGLVNDVAWKQTRELVYNALTEMAADPVWQQQNGLEFTCLADIIYWNKAYEREGQADNATAMAECLGYQQYSAEMDADNFTERSEKVLGIEKIIDLEIIKGCYKSNYEILKNTISTNHEDSVRNEKMLAILEIAFAVIEDEHDNDGEMATQFHFFSLSKTNLDFWQANAGHYEFELLAENNNEQQEVANLSSLSVSN